MEKDWEVSVVRNRPRADVQIGITLKVIIADSIRRINLWTCLSSSIALVVSLIPIIAFTLSNGP